MQSVNFFNVAYLYDKIFGFIFGKYLPNGDSFFGFASSVLSVVGPFLIFISLLFLTGIIYSIIRTRTIMHQILATAHHHGGEHDHGGGHDGHTSEPAGGAHHNVVRSGNPRWEKILKHVASNNSSDWRLAILECDIILDEMLTKMSYHGETLSDKLKAVEKSDFLTIDKAWEAHRVRNSIAHEGSNFQITEREVQRVVGLYEEVFKEFHYI